jgi:hypothetical protein
VSKDLIIILKDYLNEKLTLIKNDNSKIETKLKYNADSISDLVS